VNGRWGKSRVNGQGSRVNSESLLSGANQLLKFNVGLKDVVFLKTEAPLLGFGGSINHYRAIDFLLLPADRADERRRLINENLRNCWRPF
jgi:hypothetical protein